VKFALRLRALEFDSAYRGYLTVPLALRLTQLQPENAGEGVVEGAGRGTLALPNISEAGKGRVESDASSAVRLPSADLLRGGWSSGFAVGRAKRHDTSGNDQEDPDRDPDALDPAKSGVPDPERISQRSDQRDYNAHDGNHHPNLPS
jgi:hypothetical protein